MRYSQKPCSKLYVDSIMSMYCISLIKLHMCIDFRAVGTRGHWGDSPPPADFETSVYPIQTGGGGGELCPPHYYLLTLTDFETFPYCKLTFILCNSSGSVLLFCLLFLKGSLTSREYYY